MYIHLCVTRPQWNNGPAKCTLIIHPHNKVVGGYIGFTPSVRPSRVRPASHVRSVAPTVLVGSISYLHILSSNFRRCVACQVSCKICNFDVLFWLGICCESLVWVITGRGGGGGGGSQNADVLVVLVVVTHIIKTKNCIFFFFHRENPPTVNERLFKKIKCRDSEVIVFDVFKSSVFTCLVLRGKSIFQWLNTGLQYVQCVSSGDTAVLHQAVHFFYISFSFRKIKGNYSKGSCKTTHFFLSNHD